MKIIKSHRDAATVAYQIEDAGQALNLNMIKVEIIDGFIYATGQEHRYGEGPQRYTASEFAEFVLWPERKRVNDWIRTYC